MRGPLSVLRELWTNESLEPELRTTYQYVVEQRNRLKDTCRTAHEKLGRSSARYKQHYNKEACSRTLQVGERVLILLPTDRNKLLMQWKGPYTVTERKATLTMQCTWGKLQDCST